MTFASVMIATALLATPQDPFGGTQPTDPVARLTAADGGADVPANSMDEHIEVLRQILRKKLNRGPASAIYPAQSQTANDAHSYFSASLAQRGYISGSSDYGDAAVEGVYLPGYGVVFTTTLPASSRDVKTSEDKPAGKTISDWQRVQMELRGEKVEPGNIPQARPPSVRDTILRVLSENGQHMSRLRDDERLTVVVTFRGGSGSAGGASPYGAIGTTAQSTLNSMFNPYPSALGPVTTAAPALTPSQAGKHASSARDYEMLGDLHVKQQQHQAAIDSYRKALAQYEDEQRASPQVDQYQRLGSILARQAQSLIALGKHAEAVESLQKAQALGDGKAKAAPAAKPAKPRMPTKMIVSATKRQLDQFASGKMSAEEFRKAISVEEE